MTISARSLRIGSVLFLSTIPAFVALFLLYYYFDAGVTAFCPAYDSDQVLYTREAGTFAAVGFDGGYYGTHGRTAVMGRFGAHGPAYAVIYGGLAKFFGGWSDWLAPAFNMFFVTAALIAIACRMPMRGYVWVVGFCVLFPTVLIYLPLSYQEAPQFALALVLAIAISNLWTTSRRGLIYNKYIIAILAAVFLAALTRPTWGVLFPAVLYGATTGRMRNFLLCTVVGGLMLSASYVIFSLIAAPWAVDVGVSKLFSSLLHGDILSLVHLMAGNVANLFNFGDNRYHTIVLLIMLCGTVLAMAVKVGDVRAQSQWCVLHFFNIFAPFILYITIYNGSGYQLSRLLSAHFVLTMALTARCLPPRSARLVLAPVLAGCLALLPATLISYAKLIRPAYQDYLDFRPRIAALAETINPVLELTKSASDPWLRTLALIMEDSILPQMAAPPPYGIQLYIEEGLDRPLKAGFVLLDAARYERARIHTPLTPLMKTPVGVLYRNDVAFGFANPRDVAP